MKKFTIFLILIIAGCSKNDCSLNEKIRKIETDKIIETLIKQDVKNNKDSYAFCTSFKKLKINTEILFAEPTKDIKIIKLPRSKPISIIHLNTEIYIEQLLNANLKGKKIFKINDSINFVEQNNCFSKYTIPKTLSKKIKTISVSEIDKSSNYIILSIPIFSEDNKKAYIQIDCYPQKDQYGSPKHGISMYGMSIYLEKKDNIWKIIDTKNNGTICKG